MNTVTIHLKYLRHGARKIRPVARIFVGKNLEKAIDQTSLMLPDSAYFMNKALRMAKAAAEQKEFSPAEMIIKSVNVSEGPKIKRMRPNARGRSNKYQKHLAHILLTIEEQVKSEKVKGKSLSKKSKIEKAPTPTGEGK
ncbi:MAG TPA: uL22 family ribosomal protein [Candidatus Saccharimonadales bacterium]|nr:uL22 family ribosomal protein [Candidatus Saccharimonadales bacterium]